MHKPAVGWVMTPMECIPDAGTHMLSLVQIISNPSLNIFSSCFSGNNPKKTQQEARTENKAGAKPNQQTGTWEHGRTLARGVIWRVPSEKAREQPSNLAWIPKSVPAMCSSEPHPSQHLLCHCTSSTERWQLLSHGQKSLGKEQSPEQQSPPHSSAVLSWSFQQINCSPHKQGRETNFLENSNNSAIGNSHFVQKCSGIDPPQPVIFCAVSFTLNLQIQTTQC